MSQVKQILQLHKQGHGNKTIARHLSISKNTVKSYLEKYRSSKLSLDTLLKMEDHSLEKNFHAGNPAYKDDRFHTLKVSLLLTSSCLINGLALSSHYAKKSEIQQRRDVPGH